MCVHSAIATITMHLGSTSYLTDTAGNVSQFVWYAPYGESLVDEHTTTYENPFKFSGKELDDITGLYDHGARSRNPISTLWYGVDPLWEKYPEFGAYVYCGGNPVKYFDPDGKDMKLHGPSRNDVVEQLNVSEVSEELQFSMSETGKLIPEQICDGSLSEWSQLMFDACSDATTDVHISANESKYDGKGHAVVGGAFMGNKKINGKYVAYQLINPAVLKKLSEANKKSGADILHELLEAYIGAKISQEDGYESPQAGEDGSNYSEAHEKSYPQSGEVNIFYYDKDGKILDRPYNVDHADFESNGKVIMTIP